MKKWLAVIGLFAVPMLFIPKEVKADGNFLPVLVVSSVTNQGYLYPNAQPVTGSSTTAGGFLVNGINVLQWSNGVIGTTTSATTQQFPALPLVTKAQFLALQAATTGQMAWCTNCNSNGNAAGALCISTGSTAVDQFVVSTGTVCQ